MIIQDYEISKFEKKCYNYEILSRNYVIQYKSYFKILNHIVRKSQIKKIVAIATN